MAKILLDSEPQKCYECPFFGKSMFLHGMCLLNATNYGSEESQKVEFKPCKCVDGFNFDFSKCEKCKVLKYEDEK